MRQCAAPRRSTLPASPRVRARAAPAPDRTHATSLANVFNMLDEEAEAGGDGGGGCRCPVKLGAFTSIGSDAAATRQTEALAPYLSRAQAWPVKWGIDTAQARGLYGLIANALAKTSDT